MRSLLPILAACGALALLPAVVTAAGKPAGSPAIETVLVPSPQSPLVAIRLLFRVGSIDDPVGKEGLAALTGLMVAQAGTMQRSYGDLLDALYPMAASIDVETDREVTVVSGEIHRERLADFTRLLEEVILHPGFHHSDFDRNREQLLAYLTNTLRASNDELLGLEALQDAVFAGHPYGHPPQGTVAGLGAISLDDVERFYRDHYTRAALMVGVAGGYPDGYVASLTDALAALPAGGARPDLPPAPQPQGRSFFLIAKDTDSVGIHLGYPLPITRADADYYPLMVANSYLGEHRTFHGRLMQQLRGARGLNYGDYSYIEYWDRPPFTSNPSPNVPRREQYFSVWIRPVVPNTARFALRDALYEVRRLIDRGLTSDEFELTRDFLVNYSKLWAQTLPDRLGFHMDSRYYGMPYYIDEIDRRLSKMTVDDVNRAIEKYLQTDRYDAVIVTDRADGLKTALAADEPSPITYNSEVAPDVRKADETIEKLPVRPTTIEIVPVSAVFETGHAFERSTVRPSPDR